MNKNSGTKYEVRAFPTDIQENINTILKIVGDDIIADETAYKRIRTANRKLIFNRLHKMSILDRRRAYETLKNLSN